MNRNTMPVKYHHDLVAFNLSVSNVSNRLASFPKKVFNVIHNLETLAGAENKITIKEWSVRSGEIYLTFKIPKSVVNLSKEKEWITKTFINSRIKGNTIEIPFSSI